MLRARKGTNCQEPVLRTAKDKKINFCYLLQMYPRLSYLIQTYFSLERSKPLFLLFSLLEAYEVMKRKDTDRSNFKENNRKKTLLIFCTCSFTGNLCRANVFRILPPLFRRKMGRLIYFLKRIFFIAKFFQIRKKIVWATSLFSQNSQFKAFKSPWNSENMLCKSLEQL